MYRCEKCGELIAREKVQNEFKCPKCQHRILTKVRPQVVKTAKAV